MWIRQENLKLFDEYRTVKKSLLLKRHRIWISSRPYCWIQPTCFRISFDHSV